MTGLSKITDKILAEAHADAAATMAQAKTRSDEISRAAIARAAELRAKVDEDAKREAAEIVSRAKSGEAMLRRNTVLAEKSAMIDEVFAMAHKELLALSDEQYLALLTAIASSVLEQLRSDEKMNEELYGEEASNESYEVLLNSRDHDRMGDALRANLPKYAALSEDTAAIDGGLVVRHGKVEVNCSIAKLVEEARPMLEAKVNHTLFPEKTETRGN
jgi:V/A-type H+-transporting ATPase subunit E